MKSTSLHNMQLYPNIVKKCNNEINNQNIRKVFGMKKQLIKAVTVYPQHRPLEVIVPFCLVAGLALSHIWMQCGKNITLIGLV